MPCHYTDCLEHENGIDAHRFDRTSNHGKSERKRRREYGPFAFASGGVRRVPKGTNMENRGDYSSFAFLSYANDGVRRFPNPNMGSLSRLVLPEDDNQLDGFLDVDDEYNSFLHQENKTARNLICEYDDSFSFLGNGENVDSSNFEPVTQVKMNTKRARGNECASSSLEIHFDHDDSITTRDKNRSRKTSPGSVASENLIDLTKGDSIARAHDSAITQDKKHVQMTSPASRNFIDLTKDNDSQ